MMHYGGMGYGWMGFGWLFQLLILVLFFAVVWWLLKQQRFGYRTSESARDILDKRLASGEISKEEYKSLKEELK